MAKDFTVTVTNIHRTAEWTAIFDTSTLFVKSPIPYPASLPGHPKAYVYDLDLDHYDETQRQRLVDHIAAKFGIPAHQVAAELEKQGVPILADDCTPTIRGPQRWL